MISVSGHIQVKRIIQIQDWHNATAHDLIHVWHMSYIRSMQSPMLECIGAAVDKLETQCGDQLVEVDLQHLIQSWAVDIIGVTTFGQSFNVLQNDSHPPPDQIKQR
ncbi:hypothetical protein J3F83DRAFT_717918 [Trichoderma novae-zelandiae]